jgi:hypothetical protein
MIAAGSYIYMLLGDHQRCLKRELLSPRDASLNTGRDVISSCRLSPHRSLLAPCSYSSEDHDSLRPLDDFSSKSTDLRENSILRIRCTYNSMSIADHCKAVMTRKMRRTRRILLNFPFEHIVNI